MKESSTAKGRILLWWPQARLSEKFVDEKVGSNLFKVAKILGVR